MFQDAWENALKYLRGLD